MSRFSGERAVVVGLGVSGSASAEVLASEGASVRVSEERPLDRLDVPAVLTALGVEVAAGGHDPKHLDDVTLVVTSPGVPPDAPILREAHDRGLPIWGELELGARLAEVPYLAVTGTNGKTTTVELLAACLRADGIDAVACGNVGHPFPLAAREDHAALVVEASSFQLRFADTFHPRVSVLLNLAPDHLDWHGSFDAYRDAKARIAANQTAEDTHVGNRDDPGAAAVSWAAPCPVRWFRAGEPPDGEIGYDPEGELVSRIGHGARLGWVDGDRAGFRADAAAAAAAALSFGVTPASITAAIAGFEPLGHRGETVAVVDGVRFIDNSKATNVHAALAALAAVHDAVLIAGGRAKGVDLSPLRGAAGHLAAVVAIGEAAPDLEAVFDGEVPVRRAGSIEEAVAVARDLAPQDGAVLLAPACASWDMFRDYVERGERFAAAARALAGVGARG
ncbi:MAG: UDP-N-acetylmuramoylalanine--D-glutamate ligase [Solirubrobacterales bacterium]|nr:UDP-N-acetylmuramoylalanine--D-glutamate ligase [Solirubrobacterales bacterium]